MTTIETKAAAVRDELASHNDIKLFALDPAMIAMLIQAIMEIIKLIQGCKKPSEEVAQLAKATGLHGKQVDFFIRRAIRKAMNDEEMLGLIGPKMIKAVRDVGKGTTAEEATALFAEVG